MKSIERQFNKIKERNNDWSSYICFAKAITGQKFSKETLHRWFNKLVEKDDYATSEKKDILAYLYNLTNAVTTPEKGTKSSV